MSAVKAAIATLNPFSPDAKGAALPTGSCTASHRVSAVIRADAAIGTDGTMVLMANPSVANDCACLWFSSGGGANLSLDNSQNVGAIATTALGVGNITNAPFNNAAITARAARSLPFAAFDVLGQGINPDGAPNVRARVVSAGVKLTFSGATLSDGGVFYSLVEPTHDQLFQVQQDVLSNYTSTKVQRGALRREIELNLFPVTRAQQEFSNSYDEIKTNWERGLIPVENNASVICNWLGALHCPAPPDVAGDTSYTVPMDSFQNMRNALSLLYPLSRRNSYCGLWRSPLSDVANTVSYTQGTGAVVFAGNPTQPNPTWQGFGINATTTGAILHFPTDTTQALQLQGQVIAPPSNITAARYLLTGVHGVPAVFAGILINAGTAMAGQTVHIEYVVHVEYSGVGVQGRTIGIVPDEAALQLTHAVCDHAREVCGQNEHADMMDCAVHAFERFASNSAPQVAAVVADAIAPGTGGLASKGVSTLMQAIRGHHKKRKL